MFKPAIMSTVMKKSGAQEFNWINMYDEIKLYVYLTFIIKAM